jgi:hypothetical protein
MPWPQIPVCRPFAENTKCSDSDSPDFLTAPFQSAKSAVLFFVLLTFIIAATYILAREYIAEVWDNGWVDLFRNRPMPHRQATGDPESDDEERQAWAWASGFELDLFITHPDSDDEPDTGLIWFYETPENAPRGSFASSCGSSDGDIDEDLNLACMMKMSLSWSG